MRAGSSPGKHCKLRVSSGLQRRRLPWDSGDAFWQWKLATVEQAWRVTDEMYQDHIIWTQKEVAVFHYSKRLNQITDTFSEHVDY